jgi:hypothetical protein
METMVYTGYDNKTMEAWMRNSKSKITNKTTTMTFLEKKA